MPEMIVNDGYSLFYRFCNFLENIQSADQQCYQTDVKSKDKLNRVPYQYGEEVLYKNAEHVEKGVIENIKRDIETKKILYDIKFRDDRKLTANEETY